MLPDFNRLRVFIYIYEEKSSTKAALKLGLTQSGVSQHLKKLEEEMGISLFTRVSRRLVPTTAADNLYLVVKKFIEELQHHANAKDNTPKGFIRLGTPVEFGISYMPKIFACFRKMYPQVQLQLEFGDPPSLYKMLAEGIIDFAYIDILPFKVETPWGESAYHIKPMMTEEFVLACSKRYYKDVLHVTHYDKLIKAEFISYKKDISLFQSWFNHHFAQHPQNLNLSFIVDSASGIINAIQEDLGLGIVVSHLIADKVRTGEFITISPQKDSLLNTIAMVHLKNREETFTEKIFKEHFQVMLKDISHISLLNTCAL